MTKQYEKAPANVVRKYFDIMKVPKSAAAIPVGRVIAHNPGVRAGGRGFRPWLQALDDTIVLCKCGGWPSLGQHYRPDTAVAAEWEAHASRWPR